VRRRDWSLSDAWVGHIKIHPPWARREITDAACAYRGPRRYAPETTCHRLLRRQAAMVATALTDHCTHDTVRATGQEQRHDDWKTLSRAGGAA
jgi:hypothetical protein